MSFILVRYKSNGTIDSSFGKDGSTFNGSGGTCLVALAVLSMGKYCCGYTFTRISLIQYKRMAH
jgi:hypothetical protein